MSMPVLTAVTNASWEAELVAAAHHAELGVTIVRRCVDVADLLATAATGTARAVVLSADLHRLDGEVLARLAASGVAVVGLVETGDAYAEQRMQQLGITRLLPADASASAVASALVAAVSDPPREGALASHAAPAPPAPVSPASPLSTVPAGPPSRKGSVVAVWGPTGAPGRSTVALGLADAAAAGGTPTLLVDADTYGGAIAQLVGLRDEAPGLAAAVRLANQGQLDGPALAVHSRRVAPRFAVLTGITRADRWPELAPSAVSAVLAAARQLAPLTIVDCGFCVEQDEELVYDVAAPRRNGATLAVLDHADIVLVVGAADPLGMQRLIGGIAQLAEAVPHAAERARVIVNKIRRGPIGDDPAAQVAVALQRFAGVQHVQTLPYDRTAVDATVRDGRMLSEAAPNSPLAREMGRLSSLLVASLR